MTRPFFLLLLFMSAMAFNLEEEKDHSRYNTFSHVIGEPDEVNRIGNELRVDTALYIGGDSISGVPEIVDTKYVSIGSDQEDSLSTLSSYYCRAIRHQ